MAEDNHQTGAKVFNRVLDASQRVVVHKVSRGTDHEKIAQILIKNDLRGCARIGASDYHGKGVLGLGGGGAGLGRWFFRTHRFGSVARIASLELGKGCFGSYHGGVVMVGSGDGAGRNKSREDGDQIFRVDGHTHP